MFKVYRVPETLECGLVLQFLSSDCTVEAARLMTWGQRSVSELKRHVFDYLGLSANRLRELFGEAEKLPHETWWSASVRARTLLDAYLDSRKFKAMAIAEAARHVVLTECGDWMKPKELSRCLEHFEETERVCLRPEHVPEKPKVAEKAGAKRSRDKKRRKCFACKAVGHLISECPVVDPGREARTLDVPETSEVGDFTGRNTDPEDKASRKTRFKEEPARVHRQFGAVFHGRGGRGLGGRERRDFGLLGDLLGAQAPAVVAAWEVNLHLPVVRPASFIAATEALAITPHLGWGTLALGFLSWTEGTKRDLPTLAFSDGGGSP
ncbi:hypothetical protein HPB47_002108 [Ixodes persulcatus]|uniref:Uncharacterized protein n=1 Tax=Ixodes persulcatus TaxID=34615 RepID=A0AC60PM84_IXOPE|nr:hypothetical protein HPB47_002108 [Ixodes persulcatus]